MIPKTPMLRQYFQAKEDHPGVLLAMRVGDFYEFYGPDAEAAAGALQITLTGREDGENGRIPMAGVPFHSVEKYLARLVQQGFKVALCDQVEDPKTAKGLVRRAVTRVLTPGTLVEESMLAPGANQFLSALARVGERTGLATFDTSTGELVATEIGTSQDDLLSELSRLRPAELLVPPTLADLKSALGPVLGIAVTEREAIPPERAARDLQAHFSVARLEGFGLAGMPAATSAVAAVLEYARHGGLGLEHVDTVATYQVDRFMALDPATRRSLELTANLSDGSRRFTLLEVLDQTRTAPGTRLLRRWIEQPLLDPEAIQARLDAVEALTKLNLPRADLREALHEVGDIERLVGRCATGHAGPRDLAALARGLGSLKGVRELATKFESSETSRLAGLIDPHEALTGILGRAMAPEPPNLLRDGGVIADGYDAALDEARHLAREGRSLIAGLEAKERDRTGITTLKVGFNSVFGYYLEAGKQHHAKVPPDWVRKQTTANAERYISAELKELESSVLGAGERALAREAELFNELRNQVTAQSASLLGTARALAQIDVLASLAEVARARGYRKPVLVEEDVLRVKEGRHPVVEAGDSKFVPNDLTLDDSERLMVLTGPNMSGKSTFLRQAALITLMAQIGSFVPARSCELGICDRIFARIGAKDEIALGQSTFMVEMVESAFILNHAGPRSLVILDEVGRGTSTYDGLAIAWAMLERLADLSAKTLFATHYHQLNVLADSLPTVVNYRVSVREVGEDVIWTHRVLPGGTDRSYGIHVARKAGVPREVLARAQAILADLEGREARPAPKVSRLQMTLFEAEDPWVVTELRELDVDTMTPLEALTLLGSWKSKLD